MCFPWAQVVFAAGFGGREERLGGGEGGPLPSVLARLLCRPPFPPRGGATSKKQPRGEGGAAEDQQEGCSREVTQWA